MTAGSQNIVSISAVFGAGLPFAQIVGGEAFTAVLWNDPNGDGNPNDATVLSSASGLISTFNDNVTFQTIAIPAVGLSVGRELFAGVYFTGYNNKFPMGVSAPGVLADSWVWFNATAPLNLKTSPPPMPSARPSLSNRTAGGGHGSRRRCRSRAPPCWPAWPLWASCAAAAPEFRAMIRAPFP